MKHVIYLPIHRRVSASQLQDMIERCAFVIKKQFQRAHPPQRLDSKL